MKKKVFLIPILALSLAPVISNAQVRLQTAPRLDESGVFDVAVDPETLAESIVIFVPLVDMPLHIPKDDVQILNGEILNVEMGAEPETIIMHADTIITPLTAGVPVKMYLIRERETDHTYYPIAISNYVAGAEQ